MGSKEDIAAKIDGEATRKIEDMKHQVAQNKEQVSFFIYNNNKVALTYV